MSFYTFALRLSNKLNRITSCCSRQSKALGEKTKDMYKPKVEVKANPYKRWHQPDKRFFACGACQILAHAFLEIYPESQYHAVWVKPAEGFRGSHVFVTDNKFTFDYQNGIRCIIQGGVVSLLI